MDKEKIREQISNIIFVETSNKELSVERVTEVADKIIEAIFPMINEGG